VINAPAVAPLPADHPEALRSRMDAGHPASSRGARLVESVATGAGEPLELLHRRPELGRERPDAPAHIRLRDCGVVPPGRDLRDAALAVLERLGDERGHEETTAAVEAALNRAMESVMGAEPTAETVQSLGEGWVAEEALAIGLYCALVARDFAHGVLLAVNHGGDSDSTGAIAGKLLGLVAGESGIPGRWRERLELGDVIAEVADDLWLHFGTEQRVRCRDQERYPPT
jgi:hypothetical protein